MPTTHTLATQYPFTFYATTPAGRRFAVGSYPTRASADASVAAWRGRFTTDTAEIVDRSATVDGAMLPGPICERCNRFIWQCTCPDVPGTNA